MGEYSEAFVGIHVAKGRNAIAIADGVRAGEVRSRCRPTASGREVRLEWPLGPDSGQAAGLAVGRACYSSKVMGLRYPRAECSRRRL